MSGVRVRALGPAGEIVHEQQLSHGADPARLLVEAGLTPRWSGAHRDGEGDLVLDFAVPEAALPGEVVVPYQRPAAYAVVVAERRGQPCLLLTSFTDDPAGRWGLPGGGIDPGEDPVLAVVREVWEETGQRVRVEESLVLSSGHWTGRSRAGRLEDFHAVRLVYRASCPDPVPTQVLDVGGSTDQAQWVPLDEVRRRPLVSWTRPVLEPAGI